MMEEVVELYKQVIKKLRPLGKGQYIGICPFHNDTNPSWSGNEDGLWMCHACGEKGNAYQLAERMGIDPTPFKTDGEQINNPPINRVELQTKGKKLIAYLDKNWNSIKKPPWDRMVVEQGLVGFDPKKGRFVFIQRDIKGNVTCLRYHKGIIIGDGGSQLYPLNLLDRVRKKGYAVICEGLKDALTLWSVEIPALTCTTGASSIPSAHLKYLKGLDQIIICYDKDDSGNKGSQKMAKVIKSKFPNQSVQIAHFLNDKPEGYDITNCVREDPTLNQLHKVIGNAMKYDQIIIGGYKMLTGNHIAKINPKPLHWFVNGLVPKGHITALGGTTGSNKSYFSMELGMRIATGLKEFLGYEIPKRRKVLYVNLEVPDDEVIRRFHAIKQNIGDDLDFSRFMWNKTSDEVRSFEDKWDTIEEMISTLKPDLVIVDNLYASSERNMSKNDEVKRILKKIEDIRCRDKVSFLLVCHFNKYNTEQGLVLDRMQGASALGNWLEHIILLTRSEQESSLRLMRIIKSRVSDYSNEYFGIMWDVEKLTFRKIGIIDNPKLHFTSQHKTRNWQLVLDNLSNKFTTENVRNIVENEMGHTKTTAFNWINEWVKAELVKKLTQGVYEKTGMKIIKKGDDLDE